MNKKPFLPHVEEIIENFSLFDDWEERYRYLIDMGRALPPPGDSLRAEENLVRGCTSRVWMQAEVRGGVIHIVADSDAHIVRGLVALLLALYNGRSLAEAAAIDMEQVFSTLGLDEHLSPNRRSGFFSMVEKIRALRGMAQGVD